MKNMNKEKNNFKVVYGRVDSRKFFSVSLVIQ